jgi:hypothetical protein
MYDFDQIFNHNVDPFSEVFTSHNTIPKDTSITDSIFEQYIEYKEMLAGIEKIIDGEINKELDPTKVSDFIRLNSEYYRSYQVIGDYYKSLNKLSQAKDYYKLALSKEIPHKQDRQSIIEKINEVASKLTRN